LTCEQCESWNMNEFKDTTTLNSSNFLYIFLGECIYCMTNIYINMVKYHNNPYLKHCLQICFLILCIGLVTQPVMAVTDSFKWVGSNTAEVTVTAQQTYAYNYAENRPLRLYFPNVELTQKFSQTTMVAPVGGLTIYGGDGTSGWDTTVTFRYGAIDGPQVGTGIVGYNKNDAGTHYFVSVLVWDLDLSEYTGAAYVYLDDSTISFNSRAGYTSQYSATAFSGPQDSMVFIQAVYHHTVDEPWPMHTLGEVGWTYTTSITYDYENTFEYYPTMAFNYFELNRTTAKTMKSIIEIGGIEVINETIFTGTDLEWLSADLTNNTWSVTGYNILGDYETKELDFSLIERIPQAENTILWDEDEYYVGDTGNYSWSLSDSNWDTVLYSKKASIYRDGTMVSEFTLPAQTGTFYYNFDKEGNYEVKLRKTSSVLPHVTIYTDSANVVPLTPSYLTVSNVPLYTNTPMEFQYSYGFEAEIHYNTGIKVLQLVGSEWFLLQSYSLIDELPNHPNTIQEYSTINASRQIQAEGDYKFILTDYIRGDVAETGVYHVTYRAGTLTDNITTSDISLQSMIAHVPAPTTYQSRDSIYWAYKIDNVNYTNGLVYFEVYSVDQDMTTMSALLSEQVSSRIGTIYNTGVTPNYYALPAVIVGMVGENQFRLVHENSSGRTILDFCTFNLTSVSYTGYGLELNKYSVNVNEDVTAIVTIPSAANLVIKNPQNGIVANYSLNASTVITRRFPITGTYTYLLIPAGSNTAEATASLQVEAEIAGPGVDTPEYQDSWGMAENMFNFMSLPAFWGLIIIIGFVGSIAMKTNVNGNALAFITFALVNLFALVGLFDPYGFYIIILTWILAGMMFGIGRKLVRGDE